MVIIRAMGFGKAREVILIQLIFLLYAEWVADGMLSGTEDLSVVTDERATIDFDAGNVDLQFHKLVLTCGSARRVIKGECHDGGLDRRSIVLAQPDMCLFSKTERERGRKGGPEGEVIWCR